MENYTRCWQKNGDNSFRGKVGAKILKKNIERKTERGSISNSGNLVIF